MKTMMWRQVGRFMVTVHSGENPTDEEWAAQVALIKQMPARHEIRGLVFSEGGRPNAKQRQAIDEVLGKTKVPIALLTNSEVAKAVGGIIRWIHPHFRTFSADDMHAALEHLGASAVEYGPVTKVLAELRALMGAQTATSKTA